MRAAEQQVKPSAKPLAKRPAKVEQPFPNIITQVSKGEEPAQVKVNNGSKLLNCCKYIWKCFPLKSDNESFDQIQENSTPALLEPQLPQFKGRKCLVLDLDETLVHSTFEPVQKADLVLPVRIQGMTYRINVIKRPGCEEFLARMGELYEVVVFTASLAEYAEPLVKILDTTNAVSSILYRQHCTPLNGVYVKDLTLLGRDMKDIILVDNSPNSFLFQPENAYHIKNFFDDKTDRELVRLANFLEKILKITDVRPIEELRKRFEPQTTSGPTAKAMKFVKVVRNEIPELNDSASESMDNSKQPAPLLHKKEEIQDKIPPKEIRERERTYGAETEPDLRKGDRGDEFYMNTGALQSHEDDDDYKPMGYGNKAALTDRIGNDRPMESTATATEDLEMPNSPKESDGLINSRNVKTLFNNNKGKPLVPALAKNNEEFNKLTRNKDVVVVEEHTIDGNKVEDVRMLTGMGNLNSPLGRHVKIEFNGNNEHKQDTDHGAI